MSFFHCKNFLSSTPSVITSSSAADILSCSLSGSTAGLWALECWCLGGLWGAEWLTWQTLSCNGVPFQNHSVLCIARARQTRRAHWVCDPSRHPFMETFTSLVFTSLSSDLSIMIVPTAIKLVLRCLWCRNASVNANVFLDCRNSIALKPINSRWIVATKCAPNETMHSR